jgi:hypothetical protein
VVSPGRGRKLPRSSIRARSIFIPRPTLLSDEEEAEEYLQASQEKLEVARRQLEALREAEKGLTEEGFAEALLGDESNIYLIEGHGDALLLELSAAFDTTAGDTPRSATGASCLRFSPHPSMIESH